MSAFLESLATTTLLADGAMGSYLFELTGRLSEASHVYEALSVEQPELIVNVHVTYLRAGAQCIKTNTFSANRSKLAAFGLAGQVAALNRASVRRAREAIERHRNQAAGEDDRYFILGSVGPVRDDGAPADAVTGIYREQIEALAGEGIDAVLFETFMRPEHLLAALDALRESGISVPAIAQMSSHLAGPDRQWDHSPQEWVPLAIERGARLVGVNCCAPWEASAFVEAARELADVRDRRVFLSAMPNAGGFERIDSRFMTKVNPEYLGKCVRALSESGVRLVGGCCEVHPPHIREMAGFLRSRTSAAAPICAVATPPRPPAGPAEKRANGAFSRKVLEREFAVSVEIVPPRGTSAAALESKVAFVAGLAATGLADAIDITDGSRGIPLIPPADFVHLVRSHLGWTAETGDALEAIPHFAARDLNVMGIQSRLMGYHCNRIHNVLFITGDPPKMSPTYPRSTAVFDLDSIGMIRFAHGFLNAGVDFGGQPLGKGADPRTRFTIGTGFEPEALDMARELDRLRQKIDAGADYIMTQPAFRHEPLEVLAPFRDRIPILAGVMIIANFAHAQRMAEVPGVILPEPILARLGAYKDPADQGKVGRDIAREQIERAVGDGWAGLYLMSPATHGPVIEVLKGGLTRVR